MERTSTISIETKRLSSGNQQIKFFVEDESQPQYGYLLVSEPKPVGEIIDEIRERLERRMAAQQAIDPFFPVAPAPDDKNFYLFSA
ncbi:hypothetical protein [Algoriphagus namhaensis]